MTDFDDEPDDDAVTDFDDDADTMEFEPLPDDDADEGEETLDLTPPSLLDPLPEESDDEDE